MRRIYFIALVITIFVFSSCTQPPAPAPAPAPRPAPPFQWSVVPEEVYYLPGEIVKVKLSFTNVSSETIKLDRWPPEIQVTPRLNYDQVLFSVAAGTQPLEISPNDTITLDFTWDQKDKEGKQVHPGWYNVTFKDISVIYETDRRIGTNPTARILIQYPQGTMEKTIELNQSQAVNGVTITLKRVELSTTGVNFYAFTIPPGYSPPQLPGPVPPPPPPMFAVHAEYIVDGVTKDAGYSGIGSEDDGIRLSWAHPYVPLDPVPSDAKSLTFRITRLGEWEGPWEFKIPLE